MASERREEELPRRPSAPDTATSEERTDQLQHPPANDNPTTGAATTGLDSPVDGSERLGDNAQGVKNRARSATPLASMADPDDCDKDVELGKKHDHESTLVPRVCAFIQAELAWIPANLSWASIKPVLRCSVAAWASLVLMLVPRTELVIGQASFFILVAAFLSPPNEPMAAVVERELANVILSLAAWAWACIGLKFASLGRRELLPRANALSILSGAYVEAVPSVVCAIFLFVGCTAILYLRARLGPGPFTIGLVFSAVALDSALTTGALYPFPNYKITEAIVFPLLLHSCISIICSVLIFPQSVNAQYIKRLAAALAPLEKAFRAQQALLTMSPFADDFDLSNFRSQLKASESKIVPLAASARLMNRDVFYGRFSAADLMQLHSFARQLYVRTEGMAYYFKIIDPLRERFPETPRGSVRGTPLPTPPSSPSTPQPMSGQDDISSTTTRTLQRPSLFMTPADSSAASLSSRRKRRKHVRLHLPRTFFREPVQHEEVPVGVFEATTYMHIESHLTRPRRHEDMECAYALLRSSTAELLDACSDGLAFAVAWLEQVNASRLDSMFMRGHQWMPQDLTEKTSRCFNRLEGALAAFRRHQRLEVIEPYRKSFGDEQTMPPHRLLFQTFLFQYHLLQLAQCLLNLHQHIDRLENERTSSKIWVPTLPWKSLLTAWTSNNDATEQMQNAEEENPDAVPGVAALADFDLIHPQVRNPNVDLPRNHTQAILSKVSDLWSNLFHANSLYALKAGALTIVLCLPALLKNSAGFAYRNHAIWAIFIGQLTLSRFRGDTVFGLFARIGSTFAGGVVGLALWYISTGNGKGNAFGLGATCAIYFPIAFFIRLYWPVHPMTNLVYHATTVLVVGYSWQDLNIVSPSSPGFGWDVAWRRFILVTIGVAAAFVFSLLPPSTTIRDYERISHATTVAEIGTVYCEIVSFANTTESLRSTAPILQRITALRAKLNRIHDLTSHIKFEASISGDWPAERYEKLYNVQLELIVLLSQMLSVVEHLEHNWALAFLKRTRFLDHDFLADILACITMMSSALRNGTPLPQLTPVLLEQFIRYHHGLNIIRREADGDFGLPRTLTIETLEDEQYMFFCVGVASAYAIITRLDSLMLATKSLVGEHYHVHGAGRLPLPLHGEPSGQPVADVSVAQALQHPVE